MEKINSNDIINAMTEGVDTWSHITTSFIKEFEFYGKTLYEWSNELMLEIPPSKDLDGKAFRTLLTRLIKNMQVASNYHSVSCCICDTISGGNNVKKSDIVSAIVATYAKKGAKRPAATVIEQMAETYMTSTINASVAAKLVKNFWKQRLDMLLEVRKILEQIGMSLHVEMKWTSQ